MVRYQISPHAEARWEERHSGDIYKALEEAVPFGAQRGDSTYMRNGEVVFVVRGEVVVTVLTLMQAIANMQQQGIRFDALTFKLATTCESPPPEKRKKSKARLKKDPADAIIGRFLDQLRKADDDELQSMAAYSAHENFIKQFAKLKRRLAMQIELTEKNNQETRKVLAMVERDYGQSARLSIIRELNCDKEECPS